MDAVSYSHSAKQAQRIKKFVAEPDATSGLVTVPSVVASGETVSIPAGRTLVHPNLQVDGTLVVDGTMFIPSGGTYSADELDVTVVKQNGSVVANDGAVVHKTGDETIAGVKTFTSSPIVPTPTSDTQAVNKLYVTNNAGISLATANSYDLGVGQTWQDVTGSRAVGTTYTNSTGKPITVIIYHTGTTKFVYVGGVAIGSTNTTVTMPFTIVVPNGVTYSTDAGTTIVKWSELR